MPCCSASTSAVCETASRGSNGSERPIVFATGGRARCDDGRFLFEALQSCGSQLRCCFLALGVLTYPGRWTPDTATQNFQINSGHYTDWYDPVFLAALRSLVVFRDNLGLLGPTSTLSPARCTRPHLVWASTVSSRCDDRGCVARGFMLGDRAQPRHVAWRRRSGFRRRSLDIPSRTPDQGCANRCDDGCNSLWRSSGNNRAPERVCRLSHPPLSCFRFSCS